LYGALMGYLILSMFEKDKKGVKQEEKWKKEFLKTGQFSDFSIFQ
jgi:hypothetical protein